MEVQITACKDDACEECKEMVGKVIDTDYPDHPLHVNCRCECEPIEESDNSSAEIQPAVVDDTIDEKHIDENNEVEVQVSVVGDIIASDKDGNPIKQTIDEKSLSNIATALNAANQEILVDIDHQSSKEGLDRNTKAAGWLSKFWTSTKGLFAKLKLTPSGRELVEGREYRKLSPVFQLDKAHKPIGLLSVAMTNTPAMQEMQPILNQKPKKDNIEMTKEEIVELIKATLAEIKSAEEPAKPEEKPEEKVEEAKPEDKSEEKTVEAENACEQHPEEKPEAKNEDPKPEEKVEDKVEDKTEKAEKTEDTPEKIDIKKDVVQEAALNQAPTAQQIHDSETEWQNLHGAEFFKWLKSH